ncbi:hypothetical protein BX666DRAFT_20037 [Dichotomocladium elegans]|nr:hypothetical protein BX666DRAFT_20037 [Dichotomocladium elegans]
MFLKKTALPIFIEELAAHSAINGSGGMTTLLLNLPSMRIRVLSNLGFQEVTRSIERARAEKSFEVFVLCLSPRDEIMHKLVYVALLPVILMTTAGMLRIILAYMHAFGLACIILLGSAKPRKTGMYKLRNAMFNLELPPKTLWFNMGLWDTPNMKYADACVKLAQKVADAMQLKPETQVLGKQETQTTQGNSLK